MNQQQINQQDPAQEYTKRENYYRMLSHQKQKISLIIGNLRLLVAIGGLLGTIFLYWRGWKTYAGFLLTVAVFLFVFLVIRHKKVNTKKNYYSLLAQINSHSLARLQGKWLSFADQGEEFINEAHPFSSDLDIFGRGSLFQWINTTVTFTGRHLLKEIFLNPPKDIAQTRQRQEAIKELGNKLDWRQSFLAEGMLTAHESTDPAELYSWYATKFSLFHQPLIQVMAWVLPSLTVLALLTVYFFPGIVPLYVPLLLLCINTLLVFSRRREFSQGFSIGDKYMKSIRVYQRMIFTFEKENFKAPLIQKLQNQMKDQHQINAHEKIRRLEKIIDRTYIRCHQLYFFFNILTLWDFHCMIALEKWKEESGKNLELWLTSLGEMEMMSSLAEISYNHPDWVFPQLRAGAAGIVAREMGHPLLGKQMVKNSLAIKEPGETLLITGSNMSGKSTLLRTIGINLVLAASGAPVCAEEFTCSLMDIYTSMRTKDNLETNTSSFYAELVRIKTILEAAQAGKTVFFLLDEIFKGTNSLDRHIGAKALINKLSRLGTIGLVSTHDLELANMAEEKDSLIRNFHFREFYQGDRILFDYKLRPGVSTTRNAIYLMKMAGIEIES